LLTGTAAKQPDVAELSSLASLKNRGRLLMFQTRSPASRASGVIGKTLSVRDGVEDISAALQCNQAVPVFQKEKAPTND